MNSQLNYSIHLFERGTKELLSISPSAILSTTFPSSYYHSEVEEPSLAPGQYEGEQDQHHIICDRLTMPLVLEHLEVESKKSGQGHIICIKAFLDLYQLTLAIRNTTVQVVVTVMAHLERRLNCMHWDKDYQYKTCRQCRIIIDFDGMKYSPV